MTQLDFTGQYTVFVRGPGLLSSWPQPPVARSSATTASGSPATVPLAEVDRCDVLFVPGGFGASRAAVDEVLIGHLRRLAMTATYVTSVCTGSLVLGAAGLLVGRRGACHWAWRGLLPVFGAVVGESRIVRDGNVITGGGITAGIDFALTLAAELAGDSVAQAIQLAIEYAPAPPWSAGRPETAPAAVREEVQRRNEGFQAARMVDYDLAAARLTRFVTVEDQGP